MEKEEDSKPITSVSTEGNNTCERYCCKCSKRFKKSFFMNLDECGHEVCKVCIYDWINKIEKPTCPVCRSALSQRHLDVITHTCIQGPNDDPEEKVIYYENSSGGILVHRSSNSAILYLAVLQKMSNNDLQWVSPKGHIESSENSLEAAVREISEEAGLKNIMLIDFVAKQRYSFRESESGRLIHKTVFWYLFDVNEPDELTLNEEEGFIVSKWLSYEDSLSLFTHKSFIEIVKLANDILKSI